MSKELKEIMNHDVIENLSRPITSKEIQSVTKNLSQNKSQGPESFTGEFYKTFKKELIPILLKWFQKIEKERMLPKSFNEASITLIPKPDKDTIKKENVLHRWTDNKTVVHPYNRILFCDKKKWTIKPWKGMVEL